MTFGQRLKEKRKEAGLNQTQVAQALGLSQSTIAHYESDQRFPSETALLQLADLLDVSLDTLMGRQVSITPPSTVEDAFQDQELIDQIFKILEDHKEGEAFHLFLKAYEESASLSHFLSNSIAPLMFQIGNAWEQGLVNETYEHYVTAIVEKMLIHLETKVRPATLRGPKVLLMTPTSEGHTLILRMIHLLFLEAGWQPLFIGKAVPIEGLKRLIVEKSISYVALSVSLREHINTLDYLLTALEDTGVKILLGGRAFDRKDRQRFSMKASHFFDDFFTLEALLKNGS